MRTLPFDEPLHVGIADGIYLVIRFTSDAEPERRVWKLTTRSEPSRGRKLYQANFTLPKSVEDAEWQDILIPFTDFRLVIGSTKSCDDQPLDVSGGLFQIGLMMSKFKIAQNPTVLEDFLPGYFELQLKQIGFYAMNNAKV